jgi:hypothetical protein
MFLLRNILSFRCTYVEKEHLILPVHLSGEGIYYPSGARKWRKNILSFRCTELEKEHIILPVHLSGEGTSDPSEG